MEANYNYSERVYVTNYGKKYHFDTNCSYIKGKEIISISLKEAKSDLEGACSRCFNKRNNKVAINRNFNNNNFNLSNFQKYKNNNNYKYRNNFNNRPYSNVKNYKNIIKENSNNLQKNDDIEENKKYIESKNSPSEKINKFTDFISSSNSITSIINTKKLFLEEKESDIDFNQSNKFIISQDKKEPDLIINNIYDKKNLKTDDKINLLLTKKSPYNNINLINNNISEILKERNEDHKISNDKSKEDFNLLNRYKSQSVIFNNKNNNLFESINKINKENDYNKNYIFNNNNINEMNESKKNYLYKNNNYDNKKQEQNYNISSSSKSKEIYKSKNDKKDINIKLIKENYKKAKTLTNIIIFNKGIINNNINSNNETLNFKLENGIYKFFFEIIPKKDKTINIECGFEVIYSDENTSNFISEDESLESSEDSIVLNSLNQKIYLLKQFSIIKKTNIIIVLINLVIGKLFIFRNKEIINGGDNSNLTLQKIIILSEINFQSIQLEKIKDINPIINYDKNDLNNADIIINGKNI